jgi:ubiquitin-protein ligase
VRWWSVRAEARGLQDFPLSPKAIRLASALFKKGGYRSGALYLSSFKREHVARGHPWSPLLDFEYRDCLRALRRGLGPAKQAQPFDLAAIASLTDEEAKKYSKNGYPAHLREVILVASWWLLREIELS